MLKALVNFDIKVFKKIFRRYVRESFSYFDLSQKMPENVYHAFTLGLLVSLSKTHQVLSNRESGYDRYDVMVIPRDISKTGIIIEYKKYETELLSRGVTNIKKLVIVFKGKEAFENDATK